MKRKQLPKVFFAAFVALSFSAFAYVNIDAALRGHHGVGAASMDQVNQLNDHADDETVYNTPPTHLTAVGKLIERILHALPIGH